MLNITPAQFAALNKVDPARFEKIVHEHLVRSHPELLIGLSDAEIGTRVQRVVEAAHRLKLKTERSFAYLGALMFRFGPAFPAAPEVRDYLNGATSRDKALLAMPGRMSAQTWVRLEERLSSADRRG